MPSRFHMEDTQVNFASMLLNILLAGIEQENIESRVNVPVLLIDWEFKVTISIGTVQFRHFKYSGICGSSSLKLMGYETRKRYGLNKLWGIVLSSMNFNFFFNFHIATISYRACQVMKPYYYQPNLRLWMVNNLNKKYIFSGHCIIIFINVSSCSSYVKQMKIGKKQC